MATNNSAELVQGQALEYGIWFYSSQGKGRLQSFVSGSCIWICKGVKNMENTYYGNIIHISQKFRAQKSTYLLA